MYLALTVIHVLACLFMIGVVLLQQGKGADMGAVFGGSSQTLFGSSGAGNFLTRMTAGVAAVFFMTSLALAYNSASRVTTTIFDDAPLTEPAGEIPAPEGAPAAEPAPQAAPAAEPAPQSAPAAEPAPQGAAPAAEPQAAAPAAEGANVKVIELDNARVEIPAEPKEAVAGAEAAAGAVAEEAQAAGEAAKDAVDAAAVKVDEAAEAATGNAPAAAPAPQAEPAAP